MRICPRAADLMTWKTSNSMNKCLQISGDHVSVRGAYRLIPWWILGILCLFILRYHHHLFFRSILVPSSMDHHPHLSNQASHSCIFIPEIGSKVQDCVFLSVHDGACIYGFYLSIGRVHHIAWLAVVSHLSIRIGCGNIWCQASEAVWYSFE